MINILLLGSGGLRVGQAGEFDYSGSQAIKAFKDGGHRVILVNPNIATVQTDQGMADKVYSVPLLSEYIEPILQSEQIGAIALGFGGQTALNLGLELHATGILAKYNIKILGSSVDTINATEDREIFRQTLKNNDIKATNSFCVADLNAAMDVAKKVGYPLMIRSGFSLGGLGSGRINNEEELISKVNQAFSGSPQVILEEFLAGWKEYEYEIVRDMDGNSLTICNMENLDPMGIHTGESIVVAPAQTLNDTEHQKLRNLSLQCAEIFSIIGECNIQFAINPADGDYRVIEMNPRLSRSSALASKATGYPLAYIAAKICLGSLLYELVNKVTNTTTAFFEPALDYIVVKIPRWDTHKLVNAERIIGSEMKSVGEVMSIGRSFPEALQKAVQMLNIGVSGLNDYPWTIKDLKHEIEFATDRRIFALFQWFYQGHSLDEAKALSRIDHWFISQIQEIALYAKELSTAKLDANNLLVAKKLGFSDLSIAKLQKSSEAQIRDLRKQYDIKPVVKQIDTVAGEFEAKTNYLYLSYHGKYHDVKPLNSSICILGSGPYSIGSSVEFDWCTVNLARQLRRAGESVIIINSNPETVSTDYDESDKLYFEPLTLERVSDILDFEEQTRVCVSVGGQIANNLAMPLFKAGYSILGTSPVDIDRAENREIFSQLLNDTNIDQPRWVKVDSLTKLENFIKEVGLPVIIRPSYVLSGAAMKVITDSTSLSDYLEHALIVSKEFPVVISEFIDSAFEIEVDGVAKDGIVLKRAVSKHVEFAGVHSGDATLVFPAQGISKEHIDEIRVITDKIMSQLKVSGPFNLQLLLDDGKLKVIECNVRASRSFPFISKVSGFNLMKLLAQVFLNKPTNLENDIISATQLGIKSPVFSYNRFKGADPVAQVEMSSTGEVACMGHDLLEVFYRSWQSVGQRVNIKSILLDHSGIISSTFVSILNNLTQNGWTICATKSAYDSLHKDIKVTSLSTDDALNSIYKKHNGLVISVPGNKFMSTAEKDGFKLRRTAIDYHLPLVTNQEVAQTLLQSLLQCYKR